MTTLALSQSFGTVAPTPSFGVNIGIPSLIGPANEILLETTFTNLTDHDLFIPAARLREGFYELEVRDARGGIVEKSEAGQAGTCDLAATRNVAIPIHAGQTITDELILNKLFNLSKPGQYSVRIAKYDDSSKATVQSRILHFHVPPAVTRRTITSPAFSIAVSTSKAVVPVGWEIPIKITVKNLSRDDLRLAVWEGVTSYGTRVLDEFGAGIEVLNNEQRAAVPLKQPAISDPCGSYPSGAFHLVNIKPGGQIQQIETVGGTYDISKPGRYKVRVSLMGADK